MSSVLFLILGVVLAGMIIASATQMRSPQLRIAGIVFAMLVLLAGFYTRFIPLCGRRQDRHRD